MKSNEILETLIGQTEDLHTCLVLLRNEQGTIHELDRDSVRHQLRALYALSAHLTAGAMESMQPPQPEIRKVQQYEPEMHVEIIEEGNGLESAIKAVLEERVEVVETEDAPLKMEVEQPSLPTVSWPDEPAIHAGLEIPLPAEEVTSVEQEFRNSETSSIDSGKSLADRFAPSETIGDMIQRNQPVQRVADKLRSTSLSDLHESIGINERFAFINQLFKGDQVRYFEAINRLNESHSQDEALSYLNQEVLPKMAWKNPPSAWKEFVDLISRRYQA